ncbi:flagellar motor switch protein FliM [Thermocaproicibacter melissae]|uniref:flagellar motor switch protein FliM n=1 Tax=Thermocaproicibacter melissae TaxID=2966552 RepID=UPI0024B0FCB2|nr:flagellar motor switch protein FliM [Thermocaproicibacter melissae]WBY64324.1 flagellar motor switch protein FliM [Thermocaproicibacter melissae]
MAEVLSQQQIDELLGSLQSGNTDLTKIEEQTAAQKIKDYDFLSPKKFTREQIRLLQSVFENYSRMLSLYLSSQLRISCQTEVLQVEEEEYREFENALSDSVLVAVMGLHSDTYHVEDKQILMEMSRPISFSALDKLLGGNGSGYLINRDYTEIEISLLTYLFKQFANLLGDSWSNYFDISFSMDSIETNPQMVQSIQPDESVAIVVLSITLNELQGNLNICLPASSLEELFKSYDAKFVKANKHDAPHEKQLKRESILKQLEGTPLTVSAILGSTEVTLGELLNLHPGDIIPLESKVGPGSITINVEKLEWFKGTLGTLRKNYAVKVEKAL